MTDERLNEEANAVLEKAREEAVQCGNDRISVVHIFAAILKSGLNTAVRALFNVGIDLRRVAEEVERLQQRIPMTTDNSQEPVVTDGYKNVVESAVRHAGICGHTWVGPEHLLVGLTYKDDNPLFAVFANFGLTPDVVRHTATITLSFESNVLYAPTLPTLQRENHVELWQGLSPSDAYKESESRNAGMGLVVRTATDYIWVDPPTRAVIERNSRAMLLVIGQRRDSGRRFWCVSAEYDSPPWPSRTEYPSQDEYLRRMIEKAREMNDSTLQELRSRRVTPAQVSDAEKRSERERDVSRRPTVSERDLYTQPKRRR